MSARSFAAHREDISRRVSLDLANVPSRIEVDGMRMDVARSVIKCRHRHQLHLHCVAMTQSRSENADDFPTVWEVFLDLSREGDKERRDVLCEMEE